MLVAGRGRWVARRAGSQGPYAVRVIAECRMELRPVPKRAVDQIGEVGIVQGVDVHLQRLQQRRGHMGA